MRRRRGRSLVIGHRSQCDREDRWTWSAGGWGGPDVEPDAEIVGLVREYEAPGRSASRATLPVPSVSSGRQRVVADVVPANHAAAARTAPCGSRAPGVNRPQRCGHVADDPAAADTGQRGSGPHDYSAVCRVRRPRGSLPAAGQLRPGGGVAVDGGRRARAVAWRAPTSPASCSHAPSTGARRSQCAWRWERRGGRSCGVS